jgi:Ribbon-helix-helix protein, copG family
MALLDEKNLAAEAAKRARFRVHHVGTKLNQAELHELEALAARRKQTQAELIRRLILRELEYDKTGLRPSAEMVEITACRLLLVNLLGPLAKGQAMTSEVFDGIVDLVKKQKARVALDRLKDHEVSLGDSADTSSRSGPPWSSGSDMILAIFLRDRSGSSSLNGRRRTRDWSGRRTVDVR